MAALRRLGTCREVSRYQRVVGCRAVLQDPRPRVPLCHPGCFRSCWTLRTKGNVGIRSITEPCTPELSVAAVHTFNSHRGKGLVGSGLCSHSPASVSSYSTWYLQSSTFISYNSSKICKRPRDVNGMLHAHAATSASSSSASKVSSEPRDTDGKLHVPPLTNTSEVSVKPRGTDTSDRLHLHTSATTTNISSASKPSRTLRDGPGLEHFIANSGLPQRILASRELEQVSHPYVQPEDISGHGRKVYFDVYGCQMNVSDTEIAWAVLRNNGYARAKELGEADVVLVMTCAIREGAEDKVWNKLKYLRSLKKKHMRGKSNVPLKIGVLGCMAERLKKKLVEQEKSVDVVAGPDSYRDLPRLLALVDEGEAAVNVLLSMDETYADIVPVSLTNSRMSAFISIMRGCDNMCSYCIVPFTRGKERSRDIQSIIEEVQHLSNQGVKEITLLGQNVNSYRDVSCTTHHGLSLVKKDETQLARGFKTVYKPKKGGLRFADLLDKVSQINPEMRIRFTSPHPKDFPDEVLYLIKERNNICKQIHLPAQCGSTKVLELMRRGYTREAYLDLVAHIRSVIPGVSLSSDFICGFCSETESDFQETLSLLQDVKYNFCYLFPYSLREKTFAHRRLVDDVPQAVKLDRLNRMVAVFRSELVKINRAQVGQQQLVLVEGTSKRSELQLVGRNDGNTRVIFPNVEMEKDGQASQKIQPGDYISVMITDSSSQVLKGIPLNTTTLQAGA